MARKLVKSYAKINISLNVLGKKEDGYHELDSIFLPLELHDSILIEEIKRGTDNFVTIDDFSVGEVKYNIASFAIDKLSRKYGFKNKFKVFIHKVIPIQAGLGGGSSNAACTMLGIRDFLKLKIDDDELMEIAKTLGADVPFFIKCEPSRAKGIGDKLEKINVANNYYVLIVKPHVGLSTRDVFAKADTMELVTGDIDAVQRALETGDDELLAKSLVNSLEKPAIELVPEIQTIKDILYQEGLKIVQMTGSGTTVFALSRDKSLLKKVLRKLEDNYICELTKIKK